MKAFIRRIKRHFGISAEHVAVKPDHAWYWRLMFAAGLIFLGYVVAYWQFAASSSGVNMQQMMQENQTLQSRMVQIERQLQVERAAQSNKAVVDQQERAMKSTPEHKIPTCPMPQTA